MKELKVIVLLYLSLLLISCRTFERSVNKISLSDAELKDGVFYFDATRRAAFIKTVSPYFFSNLFKYISMH